MMVGAPLSTVVAKRFGPRVNVLAMSGAMIAGVLLLTQVTIDSGTVLPVAALFVFGFGAGLGMPALTDTVMAAVPERDAGVASAVNDVSREFGGALGIATIGSVVAGFYRGNIESSLPPGCRRKRPSSSAKASAWPRSWPGSCRPSSVPRSWPQPTAPSWRP